MTEILEIFTPPPWERGCSPLTKAVRKYYYLDDRCEDCRRDTFDIRRKVCKHCGRRVCVACRPVHGIKMPRKAARTKISFGG
jgi:hypothetical protein